MDVLDQLLMHKFGCTGNTLAHHFLQDRGASPINDINGLKYLSRRGSARVFIPSKSEDRVMMFSDNSGVYIYSDGFCTPMGNDISHEINQWKEI